LKDYIEFIKAFATNPTRVGAIAPSSQQLAKTMTGWLDWKNLETVVEFGPGTGVFTEHILNQVSPSQKFFAIEINPTLVAGLRERFPALTVYEGSVEAVEQYCAEQDIAQIDAIVCGLPWAAFSDEMQSQFLESMLRMLKPGGQFTTFAYLQGLLLPAGQRFKHKLREHFSEVALSRTVWRNLPPAFAYRCRR
jgi:phosphatidylethanolamine/phosphatidyl-N-methylethanolamine N-methyltransferase